MKQQMFCPVDNEVVERTDIVKGYEVEKGQYVLLEDEEIEGVKLEAVGRADAGERTSRARVLRGGAALQLLRADILGVRGDEPDVAERVRHRPDHCRQRLPGREEQE